MGQIGEYWMLCLCKVRRRTAGVLGVLASHDAIIMFLTNGEAVLDGLSMSEQAESDKGKEEGIYAGEVHVVDVERVAQGGSAGGGNPMSWGSDDSACLLIRFKLYRETLGRKAMP